MRSLRRFVLLLVILAACSGDTLSLGDGRIRSDGPAPSDPSPSDASPSDASDERDADEREDGDAPPDAGEAGAPDEPTVPAPSVVRFGEPTPIPSLMAPDASDDDPSLTSDLTLLYFNSKRDGGRGKEDIWYTQRASADQAWEPPQPASELNTEQRETGIALSADGLTIWFSSDRAGGEGGLDVYVAVRASRDAPFGAIERIDALSSSGDDLISAVSSELRTAYLARRDDEDDDYDLYVAARASSTASWSEPTPLMSLNSSGEESDASPVEGGRRLLFVRDATLRLAEQTDASGSYQLLDALSELDGSGNERDPWAADDLRYLVFSSNRTGTYLLYEARR